MSETRLQIAPKGVQQGSEASRPGEFQQKMETALPRLNVQGVELQPRGTYTYVPGQNSARSVGHRLIPELSLQFPEKIVFLVAIGIYALRSFA